MDLLKILLLIAMIANVSRVDGQSYYMPGEDLEHEGTWLQWPHNNLYGPYYQDDVEPGWVTMVDALQSGENVHVIAYDNDHRTHIIGKLNNAGVPLTNVDFFVFPTDDVWARDNGPVFVYDQNDNLRILDWAFNGWGGDTPFSKCDAIPQAVSSALGIPRIDLSAMVLEGGAIEHDGNGTMIATRSCIVHPSRNPGLSETQIENYMSTYLGFSNFIWLDGVYGQDITDHHIDGFLKFANDSTIVTMDSMDLDYWLVTGTEIATIYGARNVNNVPFDIVTVPLTQNNVQTTYGNDLGLKGSYCNYYIGNEAVIVPVYNDPNDPIALNIIQGLHPNRTVVGMNVQNLYEYGGMTHCVTQQQPVDLTTTGIGSANVSGDLHLLPHFPNPTTGTLTLQFDLERAHKVEIRIKGLSGRTLFARELGHLPSGPCQRQLDLSQLGSGLYLCEYVVDGKSEVVEKIAVQR